jgi:D-methionine transport system substrate-binding protein
MSSTPTDPQTNPEDSDIIAPPSSGPSKKTIITIIVALIVVIAAVVTFFVVRNNKSDSKPIRIGVVGASEPYWATYKQAVEAAGINIEIVDFTEYSLPNPALQRGDIDLNQFQHIVYLAQYEEATGNKLTPIGSTAIYPLGLYSKKYKSVSDIPAGSTVAVPDDQSNQARGLLVLQSAGLIKLKSGGTIYSDLLDVDEANSKVKVKALQADLIPSSLNDVAAGIINNDFVSDSGLKPSDAIAKDDPNDPNTLPYVNVWVTRPEDANNPTYQKLVQIYQDTPAVQQGVLDAYSDAAELVKTPASDLQSTLDKVLQQIKDQKNS